MGFNAKPIRWFLLSLCFSTAGCVHHLQARSSASHCEELLESGRIYAGQPVAEFLERCGPADPAQNGPLKVYNFPIPPGNEGMRIVVKDGYVVRASHWKGDGSTRVYFDTMSKADRAFLPRPNRPD